MCHIKMIKKKPETYLINNKIPEDKIPQITKICFNLLKDKYGFTARMSDFIQLLETTFMTKFELFDSLTWNSPQFLSYMLDKQADSINGKDVDLAIIHSDLLNVYNWTISEKRKFIENNLEEKIWAVFLIITDPAHEKYNIY